MKKNIILTISILLLSTNILAVEKGKWSFVADQNYCYIGSAPIKEEGEYSKRGDTYIIVYRINKNSEKTVQITAGYNYAEEKPVIVKIDQTSFEFFSSDDTAWINKKDKEVIFAMQKGLEMTIEGYSSRGTFTKDTYSLKGFTTANNKLSKDC